METISKVLPLLAGIGMFLYGMNLMASSIEKLAGAKLERTMEEWEQQPEFLRQNSRRELWDGPERQKILDEYESVTQALKESYRESVKD